jgi:hypothetical protein
MPPLRRKSKSTAEANCVKQEDYDNAILALKTTLKITPKTAKHFCMPPTFPATNPRRNGIYNTRSIDTERDHSGIVGGPNARLPRTHRSNIQNCTETERCHVSCCLSADIVDSARDGQGETTLSCKNDL